MSTPMRKASAAHDSFNGDCRFPPEAYAYEDDVTHEAVESIRARADKVISDDEWEVVDGLGLSV